MAADLPYFIECFKQGDYNISLHAYEEMRNDRVNVALLEEAIGFDSPEVIEDYPQDERGPSCLVLGWCENYGPIHICLGYSGDKPQVITVYKPNLTKFHSDYRTRRK